MEGTNFKALINLHQIWLSCQKKKIFKISSKSPSWKHCQHMSNLKYGMIDSEQSTKKSTLVIDITNLCSVYRFKGVVIHSPWQHRAPSLNLESRNNTINVDFQNTEHSFYNVPREMITLRHFAQLPLGWCLLSYISKCSSKTRERKGNELKCLAF